MMTATETPKMQGAIADDVRTGTLYRNPDAHVKSIHAYWPSVVNLGGGHLMAVYTLGEAFESVNLRVHLADSRDNGETWKTLGQPAPLPDTQLTSESGRLSLASDGELILLLVRHDRSAHPELGLAEPNHFGFVPMKFCICRSRDKGRTWTAPEDVVAPLVGPEFEMCSPITPLRDGRWLLPTSTWRGWDGKLPNGNQMCALISSDKGRTWPTYTSVMRDPEDHVRYWESKIHERPDGSLLAIAWAYDEHAKMDLPNHFAISRDAGKTWTQPYSTGLHGQTLTAAVLPDGRVLSAYRRMDRPGLWLNLSRIEGDKWINQAEQPLWGHEGFITGLGETLAKRFQTLRFGAPCVTPLEKGEFFVSFWCYEDCVSMNRWFKFTLRG